MKRIVAFLSAIITLILNLTGYAQPATAQNKAVCRSGTAQHAPKSNSLLWRISGKKLSKPSYLFGTIHLICRDDFFWTKAMKESLAASDKVCLEMNLNDPAAMMQIATGMIDNSGKSLQDYFTPEQYKLVTAYFADSLDMDITMLAKMRPVALISVISGKGVIACADATSYEDTIMQTALNANKEILGLESVQESLDLLNRIPADSVIKSVLDEIQSHDNSDSDFQKMTAAYKKQDLPALYALLMNAKDNSIDMGLFLDERNKKWISRMADKMQQSSVFFAVGAGHLWGDNGVISLLRKEGYTVAPVY